MATESYLYKTLERNAESRHIIETWRRNLHGSLPVCVSVGHGYSPDVRRELDLVQNLVPSGMVYVGIDNQGLVELDVKDALSAGEFKYPKRDLRFIRRDAREPMQPVLQQLGLAPHADLVIMCNPEIWTSEGKINTEGEQLVTSALSLLAPHSLVVYTSQAQIEKENIETLFNQQGLSFLSFENGCKGKDYILKLAYKQNQYS